MWSHRTRTEPKQSATTSTQPVVRQESRIKIRELDHRASDGIDVRLLWNTETNGVLVSVVERDGVGFEFQVPATDALHAFHHPYAYAYALHGDRHTPLAV
jgi:hypothetical protein